MKHQFVFFRTPANPSQDSVVYHVWVSDSPRDAKPFALILAFAQGCGSWFEKWNDQVDQKLGYYEERVFWSAPIGVRRFRSCHVSASLLASIIENDGFTTFEENLAMPRIFFRIMWSCYPSAKILPKSGIKANHLPTSQRKNLSQRGRRSVSDAVIGMGIVSALYVLQMVLDACEKALLY